MADRKIVYLILERGLPPNKQTFWRNAGIAYECRDGSLNVKLDIHPGLTFNVRDAKSNGERDEIAQVSEDCGFLCADCETRYTDEQAHLLSAGGVVCEQCSNSYVECQKCDTMFPKAIGGTICPLCK